MQDDLVWIWNGGSENHEEKAFDEARGSRTSQDIAEMIPKDLLVLHNTGG